MRLLFPALLSLLLITSLFAGIPTEQDIRTFLDEINQPFILSINGCNFNSSFFLSGIPHFNVETGMTGLEFSIKNPKGEDTFKNTISTFYLKGSMGIFGGFTPVSSWRGFLGIEIGAQGSISPMLGTLKQYKQKNPFSASFVSKLNLLKNYEFIPTVSFSFEYTYVFDTKFRFSNHTEGHASCSFNINSLYYHFDIRENLGLVNIYAGIGWISATLNGNYIIEENEGDYRVEPGILSKFNLGLTVPVELIDVNLEFGKSGSFGFYGAALGFRM